MENYGEPPSPIREDSLQCKKHIMPERKFFKIESCGRADSLQNANHCRPTVFVYMEVAFKCGADIIPQLDDVLCSHIYVLI